LRQKSPFQINKHKKYFVKIVCTIYFIVAPKKRELTFNMDQNNASTEQRCLTSERAGGTLPPNFLKVQGHSFLESEKGKFTGIKKCQKYIIFSSKDLKLKTEKQDFPTKNLGKILD